MAEDEGCAPRRQEISSDPENNHNPPPRSGQTDSALVADQNDMCHTRDFDSSSNNLSATHPGGTYEAELHDGPTQIGTGNTMNNYYYFSINGPETSSSAMPTQINAIPAEQQQQLGQVIRFLMSQNPACDINSDQRATDSNHPLPNSSGSEQHNQHPTKRMSEAAEGTHQHDEPDCILENRSSCQSPSPVNNTMTVPKVQSVGAVEDSNKEKFPFVNVDRAQKGLSEDFVRDSVSIIDSKGQRLLPGDIVWVHKPGNLVHCVYIGRCKVVRCNWQKRHLVLLESLDVTAPFGKVKVTRGECGIYKQREQVSRARGQVGKEFFEGDRWWDFPTWVYTGMKYRQAEQKGFKIDWKK